MPHARLSVLATWPPGVIASSGVAAVFCFVVIGFVAALAVWGDHPFSYYSVDPTTTHGTSPSVGLLSQLGVLLLWGAGSAGVFAGAFVARRRGWRQALPILVAGAGIAYLAFDDLFRLHEDIYPRLHLEQEAVYLVYAGVGVAFLWWYRDVFRRHEWPLLALAFCALGLSVLSDQKVIDLNPTFSRWLEDGIKLFGVAFLALYVVRLSLRMLGDAYPAEPPNDTDTRLSRRRARLLGAVTTAVFVAAACALVLGIVAVVTTVSGHRFGYYSKDPASTLGASPLVGLLSYAGVLVAWGAGSACVLAGAFVARARGWRPALPLLAVGAGTAYVALDDLFRLQEHVYPLLDVGKDSVFIGYIVLALGFVWYRDVFRHHEWPLAALVFALLGTSVVLDASGNLHEGAACLELFGLAFLATYLLRFAARVVAQSYAVVATRPLATERDVADALVSPRVATRTHTSA
jgi:hypothetical protein